MVALDRLTNAVAMSSAGFPLDLAQFKLGIDRKLVYCVRSSMKCLYFTLINSSRIVKIAVLDEA